MPVACRLSHDLGYNGWMILQRHLRQHLATMVTATGLALALGAVSAVVYALIGPAFQVLTVGDPNAKLAVSQLVGPNLGAWVTRLTGLDMLDAGILWSRLPLWIVVLALVRAGLGAAQWFMWERLSEVIGRDLRNDLVDRYLRSDPSRHSAQDADSPAQLAGAVTNDIRMAREYVVHFYGGLPRELFQILFFFITLWLLSPQLLAVFLLGIGPVVVILSRLGKKLRRRSASALDDYARLAEWIQQRLLGIETIKHSRTEASEAAKLVTQNQALRDRFYKIARTKALIPVCLEIMAITAMALVLYLFLDGTVTGGVSGSVQLSFFSTLAVLAQAAAMLGKYVNSNREGVAALARLDALFADLDGIRVDRIGGWRRWQSSTEVAVTLTDVTLSYRDCAPVLNNVSYQFESGRVYCLAGPSGVGKSSILNLVLGLVPPDRGSVTITVPDTALESIGYVPQICPLFPGTLADNVAYPEAASDPARLAAAVAATRLNELIGGSTRGVVGADGISGGQAQRIFLARMLYHRPPIVLIDEGTSALDPVLEAVITAALQALARAGALVIMAAHRPSTIMMADEILLLGEGKIVAQGTPETMAKIARFQEFLTHPISALPSP